MDGWLAGWLCGRAGEGFSDVRTRVQTCARVYTADALGHTRAQARRAGRAVANEQRERFISAPRSPSLVVTARRLSERGGGGGRRRRRGRRGEVLTNWHAA